MWSKVFLCIVLTALALGANASPRCNINDGNTATCFSEVPSYSISNAHTWYTPAAVCGATYQSIMCLTAKLGSTTTTCGNVAMDIAAWLEISAIDLSSKNSANYNTVIQTLPRPNSAQCNYIVSSCTQELFSPGTYSSDVVVQSAVGSALTRHYKVLPTQHYRIAGVQEAITFCNSA